MKPLLDQRPILVALAGPNGAGKTIFYHAHLAPSGLRFLNPDLIAKELRLTPEDTSKAATALREALVREWESFVFETIFSDPIGDKIRFLKEEADSGYTVVLCFIGLAGLGTSKERVAMRVSQGGHDVPQEKLAARFPRTLANLKQAIHDLPYVALFDNEDLQTPFRKVAVFEHGRPSYAADCMPAWLAPCLP